MAVAIHSRLVPESPFANMMQWQLAERSELSGFYTARQGEMTRQITEQSHLLAGHGLGPALGDYQCSVLTADRIIRLTGCPLGGSTRELAGVER